jgi:phosphatidylserine decarboxylase
MSDNSDKPIEVISRDNLPDTNQDETSKALEALVDYSSSHSNVAQGIHARMHLVPSIPWLHPLVKGIEKVATKYHVGNYVVVRDTGEKIFESMPIYARIGMHLLFYGKEQVKLLEKNRKIEGILKAQSVKEGRIYDSPESTKSIPSFVHTYSLQLNELLYPDLGHYKTFNEFFYRQLREDARPVQNAADPSGFCSAADSRLVVYQTVALAQQFWIKGDEFSIAKLLNVDPGSERAATFDGSSLALFRLAPADYHRFHSPVDAVVGEVEHIPGQYYTVNPQAVNEPDFDVFTANTRSVLYLTHEQTGRPVAFIAIGALLVGSIRWTSGGETGKSVKRGDELGYFAYGGSTVVVLFPTGVIDFDDDLVANSKVGLETLMKVGYSLGHGPKK